MTRRPPSRATERNPPCRADARRLEGAFEQSPGRDPPEALRAHRRRANPRAQRGQLPRGRPDAKIARAARVESLGRRRPARVALRRLRRHGRRGRRRDREPARGRHPLRAHGRGPPGGALAVARRAGAAAGARHRGRGAAHLPGGEARPNPPGHGHDGHRRRPGRRLPLLRAGGRLARVRPPAG